jgi:hypothetical protein
MRYCDALPAMVNLGLSRAFRTPARVLIPRADTPTVNRWLDTGGVRYWRSSLGDHWITPAAAHSPDPLAVDLGLLPPEALWDFIDQCVVLSRRIRLTNKGTVPAKTARWLYRIVRRKRLRGRCYNVTVGVGGVVVLHCFYLPTRLRGTSE